MVEPDRAVDTQQVAAAGEPGKRDAIAEHIMEPAQFRRLWRDDKLLLDQLLVVAVARPQHHPMLAEGNRLLVPVGRDMANGQEMHRRRSLWCDPESRSTILRRNLRPVRNCGRCNAGLRPGGRWHLAKKRRRE